MKTFLIRFFLFTVPVILFVLFADFFFDRALREARKGDYAVWNDLLQGRVSSDVLIYGSSRAKAHMDTKLLEKKTGLSFYNLGIDGHNFFMQYTRHKLVEKFNKKPKLIIYSVDYFMFSKRKDLYNLEQFLPYFDDTIVKSSIKTYEGFADLDYVLPLTRYAGCTKTLTYAAAIAIYPPLNRKDRYKGFEAMEQNWTSDFEEALRTRKSIRVPVDTPSVAMFDRFLTDMKLEGIKVVMVYTPEHVLARNFVSNNAQIFDILKSMAKKHGLTFLDYSSDPICTDKQYFYNTQHLNSKGARVFTNSLVDTLFALKYLPQIVN
jgi:hypothetical protein